MSDDVDMKARGERLSDEARAVLTIAEEWVKADKAKADLDHSLGVSVMLGERIDPAGPRRLATLKAEEFSRRNALRDAVYELLRARETQEPSAERGDATAPQQAGA